MSEAAPAATPAAGVAVRPVVWAAYAMAFTVGWSIVLVPSLVRDIEAAFGQDDPAMGLAYLVFNAAWIAGTVSTGVLATRVPRRALMGGGPALIAAGLAVMAFGPTWMAFVAGFLVYGLGLGIVDSGMNAIVMDVFPGRAAGPLNRLHLWVAIGALIGPLTVGRFASAGVPWQAVVALSAAGAAVVSLTVATRRLPPVPRAERGGPAGAHAGRRGRVPLPVIVLAVAVACYVATEVGITSWLVRYLDAAPVELATLALAMFWGGIAVGRGVTSFLTRRIGAVTLAWVSSATLGVAVIASVAAPSVGIAIACFALAGIAAGPVYPLIMAIAGSRYPDRTSMVSSTLASAGVVGALVYPPLMGQISGTAGLGAAMLGAALFAFAAAIFAWLGARLGRIGRGVTPARATASQG